MSLEFHPSQALAIETKLWNFWVTRPEISDSPIGIFRPTGNFRSKFDSEISGWAVTKRADSGPEAPIAPFLP